MKRTLFALSFLAASALSNGAEPVYSWEWTAGGAQITASGWHNDFTYTEGNDYASFTSSNNGSLAGSITEWNPQSPALTGAQFGSAFGGGGHALLGSIDINNIKFYNEVVLPVPEPATTSLSLMGLAALMMRRRRA